MAEESEEQIKNNTYLSSYLYLFNLAAKGVFELKTTKVHKDTSTQRMIVYN